MNFRSLLLAGFLLFASPAVACDSLILTGLDVSSSVGEDGLAVEMEGMATAIDSDKVIDVILMGNKKCIYFGVYLWTSDGKTFPIILWTKIASREDAGLVALMIRKQIPDAIDIMKHKSGLTDISEALVTADKWFKSAPSAPRRVLNIAGDGEDNNGETPERARDILRAQGIIINGIAFRGKHGGPNDAIYTANYYRQFVTGGPGSFVFLVERPEDFIPAFTNKFRLEIANGIQER